MDCLNNIPTLQKAKFRIYPLSIFEQKKKIGNSVFVMVDEQNKDEKPLRTFFRTETPVKTSFPPQLISNRISNLAFKARKYILKCHVQEYLRSSVT